MSLDLEIPFPPTGEEGRLGGHIWIGVEKPAVAAVCASPARRHGRQRRAGLVNITPTADCISVRPFSSTAVSVKRFAHRGCTGAPSEVGLAM